MKILNSKELKDGRVHVLVELARGEPMPAKTINPYGYYKLGHPMDDVVAGHIIKEAVPVVWCSVEQEWKV